jgi:hypothetical protein
VLNQHAILASRGGRKQQGLTGELGDAETRENAKTCSIHGIGSGVESCYKLA